ncbi:MAG: hypothetical protein GX894_02115 [Clostridia bacterium]|nr:hypothetical protein [Clostridia bacterium]
MKLIAACYFAEYQGSTGLTATVIVEEGINLYNIGEAIFGFSGKVQAMNEWVINFGTREQQHRQQHHAEIFPVKGVSKGADETGGDCPRGPASFREYAG